MLKTILPLLLTLIGCGHATYTKTSDFVDRDKFMGSWYVLAGRFTSFEKDAYNAVEKYTWNEKKQRIDIDFSYNKGSLKGTHKSIPQTAWIVDSKTNASWKVSPFWPLKFDYRIIAVDPVAYHWTVIGVPDEEYLWIMARDPHLPQERISAILKHVEELGYDSKNIVFVEHD